MMTRNFAGILEPLTKNWRWLVVLILAAQPCFAANHHVRAGASGNGSGADWTNACTSFAGSCAPSSLVRGDTYYVATGTYPSVDFNTAASGTTVITIKRATVANHGTDAGWNSAFDGQVTWTFGSYSPALGVGFDTSHWVFDGVTGPGSASGGGNPANYGFRVATASNCNQSPQIYITIPVNDGAGTLTDITVSHVAVTGCGSSHDVTQQLISLGDAATTLSNSTVSYIYTSGGNNSYSTNQLNGVIFDHNWMNDNWSSSANHGEQISMTAWSNVTVRYNFVQNCNGTGCFAAIGPGPTIDVQNSAWYGNTFFCSSGGSGCNIGDGFISNGGASFALRNVLIYNNTFVNAAGIISKECEGGTPCTFATGNTLENNLFFNSASLLVTNGGGAYANDYNSYLSGLDGGNSESHGQIANLNPFVNLAGGDYHLAVVPVIACSITSATCDGLTLSSPYNVDASGNIRGVGGVWARGAYEFVSGTQPNSPTNLTAIVN